MADIQIVLASWSAFPPAYFFQVELPKRKHQKFPEQAKKVSESSAQALEEHRKWLLTS